MFDKLKAKLYLMSVSKKKDVDLFWCSSKFPLSRLMGDQIVAILKIVDDELITSFNFGLKISRDDVLKEKQIILATLNAMGNLNSIASKHSFKNARGVFLKSIYRVMEKEIKFYFEQCAKKGKVKNKYNCHLEAIASNIFHSIYNADGRIPYI